MFQRKPPGLTILLFDLACVLGALLVGGLLYSAPASSGAGALGRASLYLLSWVLLAERLGTYLVPLQRDSTTSVRAAIETWMLAVAFAGLVDLWLLETPEHMVWRVVAAGFLLLTATRLLLLRTALGRRTTRARPRVLLVGSGGNAAVLATGREFRRELDVRGYLAFPDEPEGSMPGAERLGDLDDLEAALAAHDVELLLICPSERTATLSLRRAFEVCDVAGMSVRYFPPFLRLDELQPSPTWMDGRLSLEFQTLRNRSVPVVLKRTIDILGALAGVVALLPVLVACALAVRLTSPGPILFPQLRCGRGGQLFRCYKFRTMKVGAHLEQAMLAEASVQDGPAFKIPDDPRVTAIGGFLRRYSLDELPQLFNVLLGDMSLVGPRPPIPSEVDGYTWWQLRRIAIKPGLTCVWQVWGRNKVSFKRWVEMDLFYIDNWSLWLDLKLMAHTVRVVLGGTGM